jgi:uncharacterized membrane protein SpoIIM required for sporulation
MFPYPPFYSILQAEGLFIKKNKDRWERLEHDIPVDPDDMARDFTKLVDDLAYAKTFYRTSRVTQYINSLASRIYLGIYRNRKEDSNRLLRFWAYDVPMTVAKYHRIILFSLAVFAIFFAVGFFSAAHDPVFVNEILGEDYVDMTERNIENGNPFGVYQDTNAFVMFLGIMLNNVMVSFIFFFRGILLGIPSLVGLVNNSIMVGTFEQLFHKHGLGTEWVLAVLIHGLLELTALILACASGMIMGTGFLFPKTGRRWDAFKQATKDGVKLIIGLVPIFIIAAFFESYVTRYYKMPLALNILILVCSYVFVVLYFIVYPIHLHGQMRKEGAQHV